MEHGAPIPRSVSQAARGTSDGMAALLPRHRLPDVPFLAQSCVGVVSVLMVGGCKNHRGTEPSPPLFHAGAIIIFGQNGHFSPSCLLTSDGF